MKILVCGGAGYIGSHVVRALLDKHYDVVVLDNLSTGHQESVPESAVLEHGDIRDEEFLGNVFKRHEIGCVMHFCAHSQVGESMEKPMMYYDNNVYGTQCLLKSMIKHDVKKFVFSSTAAVYGEPEELPITEETAKNPTNPYGETKLAVEKMLPWMEKAHGIKHMIFRYFNASGAHESGKIGEDHNPESHLLPLVLKTAQGVREKICVFGEDYETLDGSCIRDYIHVMDIASAHVLGMERLMAGGESDIFNLGNGNGFSVKEVIEHAKAITKVRISVEMADRRPGDPGVLVASSKKAQSQLGWVPKNSELDHIIKTAWKWHQTHPQGYLDN